MNTTLKRGDIVRRYNRNKGMYQYGVVADTLVFLENKCVTCVIYREKSQTLDCVPFPEIKFYLVS